MAPKKQALLTGGAGFVGSYLCEGLLSESHRRICMDNLRTGVLEAVSTEKGLLRPWAGIRGGL